MRPTGRTDAGPQSSAGVPGAAPQPSSPWRRSLGRRQPRSPPAGLGLGPGLGRRSRGHPGARRAGWRRPERPQGGQDYGQAERPSGGHVAGPVVAQHDRRQSDPGDRDRRSRHRRPRRRPLASVGAGPGVVVAHGHEEGQADASTVAVVVAGEPTAGQAVARVDPSTKPSPTEPRLGSRFNRRPTAVAPQGAQAAWSAGRPAAVVGATGAGGGATTWPPPTTTGCTDVKSGPRTRASASGNEASATRVAPGTAAATVRAASSRPAP